MKEMNNALERINAKYDSVLEARYGVEIELDKLIHENEELKSLRRKELVENIKQDFDSKSKEEKAVDVSLLIAGGGAIAYFVGNRIFKINGNLINSLVVSVPMALGLTSSIVSPKIIHKQNTKTDLLTYHELDAKIKENNELINLLKENLQVYDQIVENLEGKREYLSNSMRILNLSKKLSNNSKIRKLAK